MDAVNEAEMSPREWLRFDARRLISRLTDRQRDVLILVAKGLSVAETAHQLGLSFHQAQEDAKAIRKKLEVTRLVQAAVLASKADIV